MDANSKFNFLAIENEHQKIDVQLDGTNQVTLRLSTWIDDLGWCSQKTLSFDGEMLDSLHHVLAAARLKIKRSQAENASEEKTQAAKVIVFPQAA